MIKQELANKSDTEKKSQVLHGRFTQRGPESSDYKTEDYFQQISAESSPERLLSILTSPELPHPTNALQKLSIINDLQKNYGNANIQRLIQAKLKIGQPNDKYELEADQVADEAMRMPEPQVRPQPIEKKREKTIKTKRLLTGYSEVTPEFEFRINALKGGGQPLPESLRNFFEPRLGQDLNRVCIHTDAQGAVLAEKLNARAFTVGHDIIFAAGQYAPERDEGRRLLAHELSHVVQQASILRNTSATFVQRQMEYEITETSISPADLSDEELEREIRIAQEQLLASPEDDALRSLLAILEEEVFFREELRREEARQLLYYELTNSTLTRDYARGLNDKELEEQIHILHEHLGSSPEDEVSKLNLQSLEEEATQRLTAELEILNPTRCQIILIDATPRMPNIQCRARIKGYDPDPTSRLEFEWSLKNIENIGADTCASAGLGRCRVTDNGETTGGSWQSNFGRVVQGGEATLAVKAAFFSRTLSNQQPLRIRGTNPAAAAITGRIGAGGIEDNIACRESGRQQFDAAMMPLLGPGGDVGVMQLCNPAATCLQRWDWTANVDAGLDLFQDKIRIARAYLNRHTVNGNYPNNLGLNNREVLQREAVKKYNGGRYWRWNAATSQWVADPNPRNNYVANVLGCI